MYNFYKDLKLVIILFNNISVSDKVTKCVSYPGMVGIIATTMIIPNYNRQDGILRVFNSEVQCIPHTRTSAVAVQTGLAIGPNIEPESRGINIALELIPH